MTVDTPPYLASDALAGIPHGFFGREGGVSSGQYAGLNTGTGSDDDPVAVAENRRRAAEAIAPGAQLLGPYQVHSARVETVTGAWDDGARPEADALVTDRPGLLLSIQTADCAPVLFADAEAGVIGAAHAGWKGAIGGVTDNTIGAMIALGADVARITAVVGPTIAQASYEVDDAFAARFTDGDPGTGRFFKPGREGHQHFDLPAYVAARIAAAGVPTVRILGEDTRSQPRRYFSYRRAMLADEDGYGRQISLIALPTG